MRHESEVHDRDRRRRRLEFLQGNEVLVQEKQQKVKQDYEQKMQERLNFFPFTHGEQLENQRLILKEIQKEDLQKTYKDRVLSLTNSNQKKR